MKDLYADYFLNSVKIKETAIPYYSLIREVAIEGKVDKTIDVFREYLKGLSNRDYQRFDEKYIKILFYSIVKGFGNTYNIKSEYETEGRYPDLLLLPKSGEYYTVMIEFKYLKREEESKLEEKMNEAIGQIIDYSSKAEFKNIKIRKYAVVCVKDEVFVEEVI